MERPRVGSRWPRWRPNLPSTVQACFREDSLDTILPPQAGPPQKSPGSCAKPTTPSQKLQGDLSFRWSHYVRVRLIASLMPISFSSFRVGANRVGAPDRRAQTGAEAIHSWPGGHSLPKAPGLALLSLPAVIDRRHGADMRALIVDDELKAGEPDQARPARQSSSRAGRGRSGWRPRSRNECGLSGSERDRSARSPVPRGRGRPPDSRT